MFNPFDNTGSLQKKFKDYIQKIVPISDQEFQKALAYFELVSIEKGEFFIDQGKVGKHVGFINKGILRSFYINDKGDEVTSCFCTENNLATSYTSLITQSPSRIAMVALERTELYVINFENINKLYQENAKWQAIGRIIAENEFIGAEDYASRLNNNTAKEKYLRQLQEQPEIVQKSPIIHIASYLGVTRRTLSRIRKEIIG